VTNASRMNPSTEIKKQVREFAEIAKECPENLQETCFRLLLENYLGGSRRAPTPAADEKAKTAKTEDGAPKPLDALAKQQGDIQQADIHVKVKRFMDKNAVSLDDLNLVFYKEGETFLPLFDSLGTTKTSESQIRVALLGCLRSALGIGEFEVGVEDVKTECQQRKCYDGSNWRNNFVNNARFFAEKFTKDSKTLRLSDEGKKELAEVVKQLK
jgi:hypothetical protein